MAHPVCLGAGLPQRNLAPVTIDPPSAPQRKPTQANNEIRLLIAEH
jgi:hypothetical protein